MKERIVSFVIRGFVDSVDDVVKILGCQPSAVGIKGQSVRLGSAQTLGQSYLAYDQSFGNDDLWDDVIVKLVECLGGTVSLKAAIAKIKPRTVQIDITSPVRNSTEQEDRFISCKVLQIVADLGADLAFGFV